MTKFTPSAAQLKSTLEHIYYEIKQLNETLKGTNNVALNNALVESRLIHVRALLDFFQKSTRSMMRGQELDDVLSSDYGFPSQPVGIPSLYQEKLNKDLAHLTYSRSERLTTEKPWPHDQVVLPILGCCKQFCEHLINAVELSDLFVGHIKHSLPNLVVAREFSSRPNLFKRFGEYIL